jgi:hypothetical protein
MRILVCGDRNWTNAEAIRFHLQKYEPSETTVIHGDCRGADRLAGAIARELGMEVESYPADWKKYGKAAGPIRNQQMLDDGKPDYVLAFHENIVASRGTRDMVERAKKAGVHGKVIKA